MSKHNSFDSKSSGRIPKYWVFAPVWILLWSGIGADPTNILVLPTDTNGIVNGIRAVAPLICFLLSLLLFLALRKKSAMGWVEFGFLGYGITALGAALISGTKIVQPYMAIAFLATIGVTGIAMRQRSPLKTIVFINIMSWVFASVALVVMLFLARELLYTSEARSGYGIVTNYQHSNGGLISRSSGLSRLAVIPAILSLVVMVDSNFKLKVISGVLLLSSISIIWFMQSRGALIAFIFAFLFVVFWGRKIGYKLFVLLAILLIIVTLSSFGILGDLLSYASREQGIEGLATMSGRPMIWSRGIEYFWKHPIIGTGPQSDRILLQINAQNSILYAGLSAGLIGVFFFVAATFSAFHHLIIVGRNFHRLSKSERILSKTAGAIMIFSVFRSIPENHAALYSIDLLLQYPAMVLIYCLSHKARLPVVGNFH